MKLKVYVVDLEMSDRLKRWVKRLGAVALMVGAVSGAALVFAATPVHVWADGDTLKATDLNAVFKNIDDRVSVLEGQAHPASAFHATLTTPTSIPNNTKTTVIFDRVDYDLAKTASAAGEYSAITGAFIPKVGGVYLINCVVEYAVGTAATVDWAVELYKNGTNLATTDTVVNGVAVSQGVTQQVALAAGDTITCDAWHNAGAAVNIDLGSSIRNSFSAARLY